MFTGIISGLGLVVAIVRKLNFRTYIIKFPENLLYKLYVGASVSINGCCLTVVNFYNNLVYFDVVFNTFLCTNFKFIKINEFINLERALKLGDEVGGHLISGHVMTIAIKCNIKKNNNFTQVWFKIINKKFMKYIFLKSFICVNGVSLTVSKIDNYKFSVNLIPQTLFDTNLSLITIGSYVNIEIDIYTKMIIDQININTKNLL
ncbi:riboflavin synthase subunit alpha [Buchnera aphidicola (Mollitrichosiphum nigrofasciatum)]|uniref:riboflavin synthase subunit alpha n=1 Tax=Buchnera aphidicola TaxID=9 RepID=UPI0031B86B64